MNIAEFVQQPDLEKLIIIEPKVGRKLQEQTWAQYDPGMDVWHISLLNDGEVTRVEEDGEAYTEKFSISDCNGAASTFYYDDITKVLYVHTSGSDDPATLSGSDPKYNIVASFWEFFSNQPKQLEPYEDILKDANGSLEFWVSATNAEEWAEYTSGSSTVNRESTHVFDSKSAYSCKLDIDASNNTASIYRTVTLPPQRKATIVLQHKESTTGKTIRLVVRDSGSNVYLTSSGTWSTAYANIPITNATVFTEFLIDFITHPSYSQYVVIIENHSMASASAYIDNVKVRRYRRMVGCKPYLSQGAIPTVFQGVGDYVNPDEQLSFGVTKINNVDGWFYSRRYEEGYLWHGREIRLRVGHIDETYDNLALFFTGITRRPKWGDIVEIGVKDERVLFKKIPDDYFDEETYPAIEEEWDGARIPYLLGPVDDIKPPQIDTENKVFKISKAVFGREVTYTWYLNEDCVDLSDWTESNVGQGDTSQVTFDGKSCYKHDLGTDGSPTSCYTRIDQDVGTLPDSFTIEIKLRHQSEFGPVTENKQIEIYAWNGSIKFMARIDNNSIDIYDGAAWNATSTTNAEKTWYVYKFVIDGSTPGSETVDVYRNETQIISGGDCSNADATNDGKIELTYNGNESVNTIHYCDYIRAYVENVIDAGTTMGIEDILHVYKTTGSGTKTELTLTSEWTKDLSNGEFTVLASLSEGDVITCEARGLKCDFEDSSYACLLADFLYFLYVTINNVSKYRLDIASLLDLKTNRLLYVGKWLSDEIDSIDFLIEMKKTGIFQTFIRTDGSIVFHRYSDTVPSDAPHFYNEDYVEFPEEEENTDQCFKEVTVRSCYKPYGGYYKYEETAEAEETKWNHKEKERLSIDSILQTQFQARTVRDNILSMAKNPPSIISMTLKSPALLLNPSDKIYISSTRKYDNGTVITDFDETVVRILKLEKDLNTGNVAITAMRDVSDFNWTIT